MKLEETIQMEYADLTKADQQIITNSKNVETILSIYKKYSPEMIQYEARAIKTIFDEKINQELKKYTKEDISAASLHFFSAEEKFSANQHKLIGIFLTELIQMHYEKMQSSEKYVLFTSDKTNCVSFLGFELNGPHIRVIGNCGSLTCCNMKKGLVEVTGTVLSEAGAYMQGGTLVIKGDASYYLGHQMEGGHILVEGNTYGSIGKDMKNGSILVNGSNDNFVGTEMKGGEITIMKDVESCGMELAGGKITIFGNVTIRTGVFMKGGEIIVEGNCYGDTGLLMRGGKITVKGICEDYKRATGGEIYQNEKRIFPE